ncbi:MaoC/PaaZ C-terminal domain-containing protein [Myxococcota bacterium]
MSVDPSVVGLSTGPHVFQYKWQDVVLYALGIGARREELDYLYEVRGPKVYPTFGVVPTYPPLVELVKRAGGDFDNLVHGGQTLRMHRALPPAGTLTTVGTLHRLYDLKRMVQVVVRTRTACEDALLFETEWTIVLLSGGGFGGPRPPKDGKVTIPKGLAPVWTHEETTTPEQALLYRLTGDLNPLHADHEFAVALGFEPGPILHGLCTFGFLGRAVMLHACQNGSSFLQELSAQFRKPVWPGETLRTEAYRLDDGRLGLLTYAADRPEPVIGGGWARLAQ